MRKEASAKYRRWYDMSLLALCATAICMFLQPYFMLGSQILSNTLYIWPEYARQSIVFIVLLICWHVAARLGSLRINDFKNLSLHDYPPVWFVAIVCSLLFSCLQKILLSPDIIQYSYIEIIWSYVELWITSFIAVSIPWLYQRIAGFPGAMKDPVGATGTKDHVAKLFEWIEQESPVKLTEDDRFNALPVAKRIVGILRKNNHASIGLIGPYGSGKTTLLNFVESELTGVYCHTGIRGKVFICRVDAWDRFPDNIGSQILERLIDSISEDIDTTGLRKIPQAYASSIGTSNPLVSMLMPLLSIPGGDPIAAMKNIDEALYATETRAVIFIEDIDRSTSEEFASGKLPAFLDKLKKLERISFVISAGAVKSDVLMRICEYQESLS